MATTTVDLGPGALSFIRATAGQPFSNLVDFSISLTGYTFSAEIVSAITGAQVVAITVTNTNLSAGQVTLSLTGAQTSAIARGSYLWRLRWTSPAGEVRTVLEGIFEVGS